MKLSLKARIEVYAPEMTQAQIAEELSDERFTITRTDLNLVINEKHVRSERCNIIRNRLEKFLIDREKQSGTRLSFTAYPVEKDMEET